MKYILALLFLVLFVQISASPLLAQSATVTPTVEYALPYPGILPDHPLYFLKELRDRILIILTRDPLKKSHIYLILSDKSLVMGGLLWEKGNYNLATTTYERGEKYLLQSVMVLFEITNKDQNIPPGVADKLELAAKKHEEIISSKKDLDQARAITHQAIQKITTLKSL